MWGLDVGLNVIFDTPVAAVAKIAFKGILKQQDSYH